MSGYKNAVLIKRKYIEIIVEQATHMGGLVNNYLKSAILPINVLFEVSCDK